MVGTTRPGPMGLDPVNVRRSYDRVADHYVDALSDELDRKPLDRALLTMVAGEVRAAGRGPLGDVGAGPGHVAAFLASLGASTVALDLSPAMARIARNRFGAPAAAGSLTALPYVDGSLGGAVALYCLIHLDDAGIAAAAGELARVIADGGPLLVAFHTGPEMRHLDEWWGEKVDLDFRFLEPGAVTTALAEAGFAIEATVQRAPYEEETTHRTYVLARRLGRLPGA
jgi:SAM-dependent methyltransferase